VIELSKQAVILARGLGRRMRARTSGLVLTAGQRRIAESGIKVLMPVVDDKTMLELIVENLSAAGFDEICLVIGPEHSAIREFCSENELDVRFVIQDEPRGTADAVLAAEEFIAGELFLVVNSDNLYPVDSLRSLRETNCPATLAFEHEALIRLSNIAEDRIAKFATVEIDASGFLRQITEKPAHVDVDSFISMNAWLFSPSIFDACRAIKPSKRGEYELTAAVQYSIDEMGKPFVAVKTAAGVLDLSSRADIETVAQLLETNRH